MTEPTCKFCGASDKNRCKTLEQSKICQESPPTQWTQQMIYRWARDQFGDEVTSLEIAIRMNKEMSELLSALQNGQMEVAREECADLLVLLSQVHYILSNGCRKGTLQDDMNAKMEINKLRDWEIAPDGSHQHVESYPWGPCKRCGKTNDCKCDEVK